MKLINNFLKKYYYNGFGHIGEGSLIPLKDYKNIVGKEFVYIGDYCSIGPGCNIEACKDGKVVIKDGCIFAPNITIITRTHKYDDIEKIPYGDYYLVSDVVIDEGVWMGQKVIVLPGVHIERGAVIGAGSVVSKSVPKYAICVGNPIRIVGYRKGENFDNLLAKRMFVNKHRGTRNYIKMSEKDFIH